MKLEPEVLEELIQGLRDKQKPNIVGSVKTTLIDVRYNKVAQNSWQDPVLRKTPIGVRFNAFCKMHGLNPRVIKAKNRDQELVAWRKRFMDSVAKEYSQKEIANELGMNRSTIANSLTKMRVA
jgi:hypothetical protein